MLLLASEARISLIVRKMRNQLSVIIILYWHAAFLNAGTQETEIPSAIEASQIAMQMLALGKKTDTPDKRVGPVRVMVTCKSDHEYKLATEAVAEINDAFGYGKLALTREEKTRIEDDAFTLYIGSVSESRKLIEDFGVSSPRAFGNGRSYYWWDKNQRQHIRSGIIALDEDARPTVMATELRRLILAALGYPGVKVSLQPSAKKSLEEANTSKLLSEIQSAVVRFCDKHIPPAMKHWEIRKTFDREWPDFSAAFWNPSEKDSSGDSLPN